MRRDLYITKGFVVDSIDGVLCGHARCTTARLLQRRIKSATFC